MLIVLTLALLLETFSLAWVSDNGLSSIINVSGSVHKNYFEYGKGTKDEPYGIANPVQLYYFSWLQYLGFFNNTFNEDGSLVTFYFEIDPELEGGLDMTGYKLPPIGTKDNPFIGNFNGNGKTISNLTVRNFYNVLSAPPSGTDDFGGAEIIGFFGVIGSLPNPTYTYDTSANEVKNLALENFTIITQTNQTLVGIVAGYVNGIVDCVGVIGGNVQILSNVTGALTEYTNNFSDYSLIGHCTAEYKDSVYVMDVTISQPGISDIYNVVPDMTSDGEGQGWGGSVNMDKMFTMLTTIRDSNNYSTNGSTYIYERVDATIDGKTITLEKKTTTKRTYYDANFGSLVFSPYSGTTNYNQDWNYLSGSTRVTLVECETSGTVDGYYIYNGTNYLTVTGNIPNVSLGNTTSQGNASIWRFSNGANGGTAYTVVDGHMHYLCVSDNTLAIYPAGVENDTSWSVSNNGISSGGNYIDYINNAWTIIAAKKISSGSNYMTVTNNGSLGNARNSGSAVTWIFEDINGSGTVYAKVNNQTYYLRYNNGLTVTNRQDQATNWTYNSNNRRLSCNSGGTTYYLRYNNGWTTTNRQNNATQITLTDSAVTTNTKLSKSNDKVDSYKYTSTFKLDNNNSNRYFDEDGKEVPTPNLENRGITYYPLTFEYNSQNRPITSTGNTGYVISSCYDTTTGTTFPIRTADIRVSEYGTGNLGSSRTNPYCMNYTTNSFTQVNSLNGKGLNKYSECYDSYYSSTNNNCYGIHFMNSVISKDSLVSVDNVTIFGETYDNYEMPTACIDFNLKEAGFINFFAGTYFSKNDTFFSLHKIERGKDKNDPETYNKILSIKEIQYIYGVVKDGAIDFTVPYYYTYKDGTSDSIDSKYASENYQIIFNTDWITNPQSFGEWHNTETYYFEIPVYAGEYALGSVEGKTGAYLVYLDLAANAQIIERQKDYEKIVEEKKEGSLPHGVELLAPGETLEDGVDPSSSAFVSINKVGEIVFSTTDGVTITHTAKDGTSAEYIGPDVTLKDGNGDIMQMQGVTTTIERTTYRDHNLNTGEYTVTVITKTTVGSNVTYGRTITKGRWNSETNSPENMVLEESTDPQAAILGPKTEDSEENEGGGAVGVDSFIKLYYSYGQSVNLTVKYEYTYSETSPTYNITVTHDGADDVNVKAVLTSAGVSSDLTFYINGQVLNDTVDPQTVTVSGTPAEG